MVNQNITKDNILRAVSRVEHPEIKSTLIDMGMISEVEYTPETREVSLTLVLPIMGIPQEVRDYLVNSLQQAVEALGANLKVAFAEMTLDARQAFFAKARKYWRG